MCDYRRSAATTWSRNSANAAHEQASGTLKFDIYGQARTTGTMASPQTGNAGDAWNKNLRVKVRFDPPLTRRFPP